MKIVIIGGTGLVGARTVTRLRRKGHEVVAASPSSGVNTITGHGLAEALANAQIVVDLTNPKSFEEADILEFFQKSGENLLAAEMVSGVQHHVALSIVGTDRLQGSGYMRGKLAQENVIKGSGCPYTIVRATQFFEFMSAIAQMNTVGQTVRLSPASAQPIAADDVADAIVDIALGAPVNGTTEIAGPERVPFNAFMARFLSAIGDPRDVIADPDALYFGAKLDDQSLVPTDHFRIGATHLAAWLQTRR